MNKKFIFLSYAEVEIDVAWEKNVVPRGII